MFSIFVGFTGLISSWPALSCSQIPHLANTHFSMVLTLFPPFQDATILTEEKNLYKWFLLFIQEKNYGSDSVTLVFVKELRDLVHLKKSRHSSCPKDMLSNHQFCLLGLLTWFAYLVCLLIWSAR